MAGTRLFEGKCRAFWVNFAVIFVHTIVSVFANNLEKNYVRAFIHQW